MVPVFIVKDGDVNIKGCFYVREEAVRFIQQSKEVYKEDTGDWYIEESVLSNNADKYVKALHDSK